MKITIDAFEGKIPRIQPRLLPPKNAADVANARLNRGGLEPIRASVSAGALGAASTGFYLHGSTFIPLAANSDAAPGPVAQSRLYLTHGASGVPQLYYEGSYYPLALPDPTSAPTITLGGTLNAELAESVLYCFTWVTSLGEESRPSPLSAALNWSPGCTVTVNMAGSSVPVGRLVTKKRIYRSVTSASGVTDLFFVAEIAAATTSYLHNIENAPPAEAITCRDYDPPVDTLMGITAMPNGVMAAFSGRTLYFCEPYIPHAWPTKYSLKFNDEIVGLAAFGSTLAVLTTGTPYVVQGLHPESMAMDRMEVPAPCVSRRGIVDIGYAAVYPSTDGLVQVSQSGAQVISKALFTREQWQKDITPATIRGGYYEGRYVMSYRPGNAGARLTAMIPLDGDGTSVVPVTGEPVAYFRHHVETGRMLALLNSDSVSIVSFDDMAGALRTYLWLSKPFKLDAPTNFGAIYVEAEAPPDESTPVLAVKVLRGGAVVATISSLNKIERLPSGLSDLWQIEVSGNCTVTKVVLAGTPDEVWQ